MNSKMDFKKLPSFSDIFVGEGIEIAVLIPILGVNMFACYLAGEEVTQFYIKMVLYIALLLLFGIFSILAFIENFTKKEYEYEENEIKANVKVLPWK